jgi:predicted small lipoprotein YifL
MKRHVRARRLLVLAALLAAAAGCGQQGPLVLPQDARPVEPLATPPTETESPDDEPQDER